MNEDRNPTAFELRFDSLFQAGRGLAFPCDAQGAVDLRALSPRARANLQRARATTGRDYALPTIEPRATDWPAMKRDGHETASPASAFNALAAW